MKERDQDKQKERETDGVKNRRKLQIKTTINTPQKVEKIAHPSIFKKPNRIL